MLYRPLTHRASRSTLSRSGNGQRDSSRGSWVALKYFLCCLALAFCLGLARFFEFRVIEKRNEHGNETYLAVDATELRDSRAYYTGHSLAKLALMGIVPFVLLIVFNLGICRALWNKHNFSHDSGKFTGNRRQQQLQSSSKQKSLILFAIIFVFVATNLPRFIADIAEIISIDDWDEEDNAYGLAADGPCQLPPKKPPKWFLVLILYSELLLVLNASVNFFVYALTAKPFRNQIVLSAWCRKSS